MALACLLRKLQASKVRAGIIPPQVWIGLNHDVIQRQVTVYAYVMDCKDYVSHNMLFELRRNGCGEDTQKKRSRPLLHTTDSELSVPIEAKTKSTPLVFLDWA